MQYVFLLYGDETAYAQVSSDRRTADQAGHYAFFNEIQSRNIQRGGAALQPTATATTVRVRGGKTLTTDGPFAETKEQLGGFYILECNDLDDAIALAAKIPGADFGAIEIRPVMQIPPPA
jgi:hypothetical protein